MAKVLNKLEESLRKIGKARNVDGKRMSDDKNLLDGADAFKLLLNGENPIFLPRQRMIDALVHYGGVRTSTEAAGILDNLTRHEIHYDNGHLYFEKTEKGEIAIGYSYDA